MSSFFAKFKLLKFYGIELSIIRNLDYEYNIQKNAKIRQKLCHALFIDAINENQHSNNFMVLIMLTIVL
jgi:hypothetical protein